MIVSKLPTNLSLTIIAVLLLHGCGPSEEEAKMFRFCHDIFLATHTQFSKEDVPFRLESMVSEACFKKIDFYMDGKSDEFILNSPEEAFILVDNPDAWCRSTPTCGGRR